MSMYGSYTAVRGVTGERVAGIIVGYCGDYGVDCRSNSSGEVPGTAARVVETTGGWSIVIWPPFFPPAHLPFARHLSRRCGALVSVVNTWDDSGWEHVVLDRGQVLDRFASDPESNAPGNAAVGADVFEVDPVVLAAYYVSAVGFEAIGRDEDAKAHDDDQFPLCDHDWLFIDMWRRLGIEYPSDMEMVTGRTLILGDDFAAKFPDA